VTNNRSKFNKTYYHDLYTGCLRKRITLVTYRLCGTCKNDQKMLNRQMKVVRVKVFRIQGVGIVVAFSTTV